MSLQRISTAAFSRLASPAAIFTITVATSWLALYPLLDTNCLYVFEADAQATVNLTLAFADGQAFRGSPKPDAYPPYFDTPFLLYSLGLVLTKFALATGSFDVSQLSTTQGAAVCSIRLINITAYAVGVGLAFLIFWRLSKHFLISIALATFVLLSPQMLHIDFLRVDHIVMVLFLLNLLLAIAVGRPSQGQNPILHTSFGAAAAALALTKVTSVLFLVMPLIAYSRQVWSRGLSNSGIVWFCVSFVCSSALLLVRFIPYEFSKPGFVAQVAISKVAIVAEWNAVFSKSPLFFYNFDQFLGYGPIFLAISLGSLTWVAISNHARNWRFEAIVLVSVLVVLSVFGAVSFKYPRGLYVLAPIYLALIAFASRSLVVEVARLVGGPSARGKIVTILGLLLLLGLYWPVKEYVQVMTASEHRAESINKTRIIPVKWISSELPSGARITVPIHSDWASPPLGGLGYSVDYRFLSFPYLDASSMGLYRPPPLETVLATTDAIVLNNFHEEFFMRAFSDYGHFELRNEWEQFFSDLRSKFIARRFNSDYSNYGVTWTEVILLKKRQSP